MVNKNKEVVAENNDVEQTKFRRLTVCYTPVVGQKFKWEFVKQEERITPEGQYNAVFEIQTC